MPVTIAVYADWDGLPEPLRLGLLYANRSRGREVFEFEFDRSALQSPTLANPRIDPRLRPFEGRQHPAQGSETFGVFADSSPDRWGRLLMRRRLEREQRAGRVDTSAKLFESDYLLGVHDAFRAGGLRYRRDDVGEFLDDQHDLAAPPFVKLRQLEAASLAIERDEDNVDEEGSEWLRMLIAPGASPGDSPIRITRFSLSVSIARRWDAVFTSPRP
jgi:serine/threonine-protein kinase HipA